MGYFEYKNPRGQNRLQTSILLHIAYIEFDQKTDQKKDFDQKKYCMYRGSLQYNEAIIT